jgi:hypothetical protein
MDLLLITGIKEHHTSDGKIHIICAGLGPFYEVTSSSREMKKMPTRGGITHAPKERIYVSLQSLKKYEFVNDLFTTNGEAIVVDNKINMSLFKTTPRGFDKKPTWIFYGPSGIGKSFIAMYTMSMEGSPGLQILETDSYDTLPETISVDIIVLGNRFRNRTLQDIISRIDGVCIPVEFKRD